MPQQIKQWVFNAHPKGLPTTTGPTPTFKLAEKTLPELQDGQVLLKNLYFSNDPAQRTWISEYEDESRLYVPPVKLGHNMRAGAIAEVVESKAASLKKGEYVQNASNEWVEYVIANADGLKALPPLPNNVSVTHYLGALGLTGITAYHGLVDVGKATENDVLVVSGAAGATGSMAVQIAKKLLKVKKVIGLAGGKKKCDWVVTLGADACIDYKDAHWKDELARHATGATLYYDNVGGEILETMLKLLEKHGRVIACGAISSYQDGPDSAGPANWFQIISMSLSVLGFIVLDFADKFPETRKTLSKAVEEGKVDISGGEHVVDTKFEDVPQTWLKLFEGGNTGKLVTKLI